jgi:soluble lytic murein transglycosylase
MPPEAFLDNITMMSESGGDPNAVSPKGARGLMQVMPATARNPGFGIRPSNGTQADDVRLGREYRAAMEKRYGGDLAKMFAAYNAGPSRIDDLMARYGSNWLAYAPAETRNYVAKNLRSVRGM